MQSLDIISINIWHILISLSNLILLYLLLKKFLYKPVKKTLAQRQAEIDGQYESAQKAEKAALESKTEWEKRMSDAEITADSMIKNAAETAELRGEKIISDAKERAEGIVRQAEQQAELELKNAEAEIKHQITQISTAIAEKVIEREVNENDHRQLIDSFIDKIGEEND